MKWKTIEIYAEFVGNPSNSAFHGDAADMAQMLLQLKEERDDLARELRMRVAECYICEAIQPYVKTCPACDDSVEVLDSLKGDL